MGLLDSLTRVVQASADIVDKAAVRPVADVLDLSAKNLEALYSDDERT